MGHLWPKYSGTVDWCSPEFQPLFSAKQPKLKKENASVLIEVNIVNVM